MAVASVLACKLLIPSFGLGPGAQNAGDACPGQKRNGNEQGDQREQNLQVVYSEADAEVINLPYSSIALRKPHGFRDIAQVELTGVGDCRRGGKQVIRDAATMDWRDCMRQKSSQTTGSGRR